VPYTIGLQGPAGGFVFYDKGSYTNGWRYMEAAPYDQSAGIIWGCNGTNIPGTNENIGYGKLNSDLILSYCTGNNIAAYLCDTLILNGYSDWFLPSRGEIELMYSNLHLFNIGSFMSSKYWSSNNWGATSSGRLDFSTGIYIPNDSKNNLYKVRAIRQF
jgi:hypothetical protein